MLIFKKTVFYFFQVLFLLTQLSSGLETSQFQKNTLYQCNFQISFCQWSSIIDSVTTDVLWTRQNGLNAVYGEAPYIDHTLENAFGFYAFVNLNSDSELTQSAKLRSPQLNSNSETCLEFWYQLSGPGASNLTVAQRNSSSSRLELWKRSGNAADEWKHVFVRTQDTRNDFWISFEGSF